MSKPDLHLEDQGSGSPGLVLVRSFACQRTRSHPARGSIERRIKQEPYAIADRLWVKDTLNPAEEKRRLSKEIRFIPGQGIPDAVRKIRRSLTFTPGSSIGGRSVPCWGIPLWEAQRAEASKR
jgi:hypothetical protein